MLSRLMLLAFVASLKLIIFATSAVAILSASAPARSAEVLPYHVETRGEGRPVYLIPGLASPGSVWDDLAERLRGQGYQTRVLTLAGFAGQPPLEGDAFLPVVRDALAAEIEALEGPKPVVVGHSLGGFMAFWLAATVPDAVAGIVAVDGVPYLGALTNPAASPASMAEQARQIDEFMSSLTPEQYAAQNRAALSGMVTASADAERVARAGGQSSPAAVGTAVAEIMTTDIRPLMPEIRAPAVLIQAADAGASESGRKAYAAQVASIPNIVHVVAEKGRHFVQLDDPEFVAKQVLALLRRIENE